MMSSDSYIATPVFGSTYDAVISIKHHKIERIQIYKLRELFVPICCIHFLMGIEKSYVEKYIQVSLFGSSYIQTDARHRLIHSHACG